MVWKDPEVHHIWSAVGKGLGSEGIWTYFPHEIEKYKKTSQGIQPGDVFLFRNLNSGRVSIVAAALKAKRPPMPLLEVRLHR